MRRAGSLVVLSVLAAALPAHAQQTSPAVPALALPMQLAGGLDRHGATGCSQSYATSHGVGHTSLEVDRAGAARLTLEGRYDSFFGPSPGRYAAGDHDFTHTQEQHRYVYVGHATLTGDHLSITFTSAESAQVRFEGEGTMPLPAPTAAPFTGELACTRTRIDVLPSAAAPGETTTPTDLVRCEWAGSAPAPFDRYLDGNGWALGRGAGVTSTADDDAWGSTTAHAVRLAP